MDEMSRKGGDMPRREFLNAIAIGTLGSGLSLKGFEQLIDSSIGAVKPPLTPGNFNKWLAAQSPANYRALLTELRADVKAFHAAHFALTPQTEKYMDDLTETDKVAIRAGIDTSLNENIPLRVVWTNSRTFPKRVSGERVLSEGEHIRASVVDKRVSRRESSVASFAAFIPSEAIVGTVQITASRCMQTLSP